MKTSGELKKFAISSIVEQFKLRYGDGIESSSRTNSSIYNRYHILLPEHDGYRPKVKVIHSKPVKRSVMDVLHYEFKNVKHNIFRSDRKVIDYYILVGISSDCNSISLAWLIPADDDSLMRNSYVFVRCEDIKNNNEQYFDYRFNII